MSETSSTAVSEGLPEAIKKEGDSGVTTDSPHILLNSELHLISSPVEWFERWKQSSYVEEKLGLLHSLIDADWWGEAPCYGRTTWREVEADLVILLLEIADGFFSNYAFATKKPNPISASNYKEIAQKAFAVLCLRVFRGKASGKTGPYWWWLLDNERALKKLLWFFRRKYIPIEGDFYNLQCVKKPANHFQEIFKKFLEEFAKLGWESGFFLNPTANDRIKGVRPQLIEILDALGKLSWLNQQKLDQSSISKLEELAFSPEQSLPTAFHESLAWVMRKPQTLEEAVWIGSESSEAAQVLLIHKARQTIEQKLAPRQ